MQTPWHSEACALFAEGASADDIAARFGRHRETVVGVLIQAGLMPPRRKKGGAGIDLPGAIYAGPERSRVDTLLNEGPTPQQRAARALVEGRT